MEEFVLKEMKYEDYQELRALFSLRYAGTCENIITNSYIWKEYYETKYMQDDNGLFWIYKMRDEYFSSAPVCRAVDLKKYFLFTQKYFTEELNKKLILYSVDEQMVNQLKLPDDKYKVVEERDYFDYIYDAQALMRLAGKKYHKKKNHINSFLKEYEGRYRCEVLGAKDAPLIETYLDEWHGMRDIQDEYHRDAYELAGIKELLPHSDDMNLDMFGVFVDEKLEAFTLGTYLKKEETAYIHVEKANPNIRGLYPFINQQFLLHCFPVAKYVNREDDMGLEGLRKAKLSYQPINFAKKYSIYEK